MDVFLLETFDKLKTLNIEGNSLDYGNNNIKTIYDNYKIKYNYNSIC